MATKTKSTTTTVLTPEAQAAINAAMMPTPQAPVVGKAKNPHAYGTPGNTGTARTRDSVVWGSDKAMVLAYLAKHGALSPETATTVPTGEARVAYTVQGATLSAPMIAAKGVNWQFGHVAYNAGASGLIGVLPNKFGRSHGFYVTPAGIAYYGERMVAAPITGLPVVLVEAPKVEPAPTVEAPKVKGKGKGK